MIILDTNVVSEPLKPQPNPAVIAWLDAQPAESLFFTSVSLAELLTGTQMLAPGHRREILAARIRQSTERLFGLRILPFDAAAAAQYAMLFAATRASGYTIAMGDGQIAAIAHAHKAPVATRDVTPFLAAGVTVINPWEI